MMKWIRLCFCFISIAAVHAETITINAEDDWAPFSSISEDKKTAVGLSVDLVRAAYATQGIKVTFAPVPFARCLYEVEHGLVAACFNTSKTDENKDKFIWPKQPLLSEGLSILAISGSGQKQITPKDLEGKVVGITNGYTYPTWFMRNNKIIKDRSRTDSVQLKKLMAGRIQYAVINTTPAMMMVNADPLMRGKVKIVGEVELSLLYLNFSKKHPEAERLLKVFEVGFESIKANGSYARIMADFDRQNGLVKQGLN